MSCHFFCKEIWKFIRNYWKLLIIVGVPLVFLPLAVNRNKALQCTYVLVIVALFWITEVLNLAITSLIPLILFPAFGLLTPAETATCYMKDITIMLIGSLIVAKTIEQQNLHTRLALRILVTMGPNPIFQYLGFMLSSWFLSMWINNTATTAMMITLGTAVVQQWELLAGKRADNQCQGSVELDTFHPGISSDNMIERNPDFENSVSEELRKITHFSKGLYLSIAYSATCGGIATLTGTGPNLIFYGFMEERYGSKLNLNFGTYMIFALPVSVVTLFITWTIMCLRYVGPREIFKSKRNKAYDNEKMEMIKKQCHELGSMSFGEGSALFVFCLLVSLWVLREPGVPLWGRLFTYKDKSGKFVKYWSDATSSIVAALLVFILPSKNPFCRKNDLEPNPRLLNWKTLEHEFSWGLVFLFGGGFALAAGCSKSGLSDIIGEALTNLAKLPGLVIILLVSLGISFLTEITSNTATSTILMPIMLKMAECIRMHPMRIALATCISSSFSFCLPAATPPNAIVFSTGKIRVLDMVSSGLSLNFLCVFVLTLMAYYYSIPIFHTDRFPLWINTTCI